MALGIGLGRLALAIAARSESRAVSFPWTPRIPEFLICAAAGARCACRPQSPGPPGSVCLAWVEFYERIARASGGTERPARASAPLQPSRVPACCPPISPGPLGRRTPGAVGAGAIH